MSDEGRTTVDPFPIPGIRWKIANYSEHVNNYNNQQQQFPTIHSQLFVEGGYQWMVLLLPRGSPATEASASIFIECPEVTDLPEVAWPHAMVRFVIINQLNKSNSMWFKPVEHRFTPERPNFGFSKMMQVRLLEDQEKGFLHKDSLIIEAHVYVQKPKTKLVTDYVSSILLSRVMKLTEYVPRPTADNFNESKPLVMSTMEQLQSHCSLLKSLQELSIKASSGAAVDQSAIADVVKLTGNVKGEQQASNR